MNILVYIAGRRRQFYIARNLVYIARRRSQFSFPFEWFSKIPAVRAFGGWISGLSFYRMRKRLNSIRKVCLDVNERVGIQLQCEEVVVCVFPKIVQSVNPTQPWILTSISFICWNFRFLQKGKTFGGTSCIWGLYGLFWHKLLGDPFKTDFGTSCLGLHLKLILAQVVSGDSFKAYFGKSLAARFFWCVRRWILCKRDFV